MSYYDYEKLERSQKSPSKYDPKVSISDAIRPEDYFRDAPVKFIRSFIIK